MASANVFFSEDELLDRLTDGVRKTQRPVVFLVGSPISAPPASGEAGVPNVSGVIDLIRAEFTGVSLAELEAKLGDAENPYQAAFSHVLARRGQNVVNDLVKQAVWNARRSTTTSLRSAYAPSSDTDDETCRAFELELGAWHLPPAVRSLGSLAAGEPGLFGQCVLTTNFDPLIEIAVGSAGGASYRTVLHRDGDLSQTMADGCHVVHLHGYWYGADTLHTPRQLTQERPRLKASLARAIKSKTLVVCGYGGWNDTSTQALFELIQDDRENTEIIWTTFGNGDQMDGQTLVGLEPGLDRGVVTLYECIDCHSFLPKLQDAWGTPLHLMTDDKTSNPKPVHIIDVPKEPPQAPQFVPVYTPHAPSLLIFDTEDQDRPPFFDHFVGREMESRFLDESDAKIIYITGIGGEGKSALAADFFKRHRKDNRFDYVIWRDCKEESERFEAQLVSIVHALGNRQASRAELSLRPLDELIQLFVQLAGPYRLLIVFDNVDHYIDLAHGTLTGAAQKFAVALQSSPLECVAIYTCRPTINTDSEGAVEVRLSGLDLAAAKEIFRLRGVIVADEEIEQAFEQTGGHAFWLDLMAAQLARNPDGPSLDELLAKVTVADAGLPMTTLQSIWDSLKDREKVTLRGLASAVRPVTVGQLADYLTGHIRWNQLSKAVKYLRSLNLVVVKIQQDNIEVIELHPIIRAFIRQNFRDTNENESFIDSILKSYLAFFGIHRKELSDRPRVSTVEMWLDAAEVAIQAERYDQAFEYLNDVRHHFQRVGHTHSFVRIAHSLVNATTWNHEALPQYFDKVVSSLVNALALMGRDTQCLPLMEMYRETIPIKNARYINYCQMMCTYYWLRGEHMDALRWGLEGVSLKKSTDVDTDFDAAHALALAQRDSGAVDPALAFFLKGRQVTQVIEDALDMSLGGAFYGNIGRCLQFMGQLDQAMDCYRKSALIIEDESAEASLANKGYIRQWVGEAAYLKGDSALASACFCASIACWDLIAPPKAELLSKRLRGAEGFAGLSFVSREAAENTFGAWMRRP